MHVGKAPLRVVQLGGGNPQVKEHPVGLFHPGAVQKGGQVPKIPMQEGNPVSPGGQADLAGLQGLPVPVDAQQAPGGTQALGDLFRVASPAQGAVDIDPVGPDGQPLDALFQQDRAVCVGSTHWRKSSSEGTALAVC